MYAIISVVLAFIRQFCLPNPFEQYGINSSGLIIYDWAYTVRPFILNTAASVVISAISYKIVGVYYRKNSAPVLGSILYMVFFCVHAWILHLILCVYPEEWKIAFIIFVYVLMLCLIEYIITKIKSNFLW